MVNKFYVLTEDGIVIGVAPERRGSLVSEWVKAQTGRSAVLVEELT